MARSPFFSRHNNIILIIRVSDATVKLGQNSNTNHLPTYTKRKSDKAMAQRFHPFTFNSNDFHLTAPIKSKSEHRDKPTIVYLIVKFMFVQIKSAQSCYLAVTKVDNQVQFAAP